jgi:hypothetical protein
MKKYLLYIVLFTLTLLSACKKQTVDPAPGERPEERVSAALDSYSANLTGNTNGWKAFLFPAGGGVYLFSMKFSTANRVTMLSDINITTSNTGLESSYRLRSQNVPSLLFDTYSYIHLLTDPDPAANGGAAGNGYLSDFEFAFDKTSAAGDTITLIGNRLGSKLQLVKATSATDFDSFTKGTNDVLNKFSQLRTYWKRITIGNTECEVKVDLTTKIISFTYLENGNSTTTKSSFYVDGSTSTMVFLTPVTIGTNKVTDIKSFVLNATNHTVNGSINGNTVQFKEAITPLKYDMTAAATFNNNPPNGSYWISDYSFTVDNIADAFKVTSIPSYSFILYYPKYNAAYSRFGYIVNNAYAAYGPASVTSLPANGRIVFSNYGSFGTAPATIAPIIASTTAKWHDPNGYYVIKTGNNAYDLVNATDARAWITFTD